MEVLTKIGQWVGVFIAGNIGIVQAVIKFIKELVTLAVDILFPVMPIATFQKVVLSIRDFINTIDSWVEKLKQYFIPKV